MNNSFFINNEKQTQCSGKYPLTSLIDQSKAFWVNLWGYFEISRHFSALCSTCRYSLGIAVDSWTGIKKARDGDEIA